MNITINDQRIEIEYNALLNLIMAGAIAKDAKIILETNTVIWQWNGKTNYTPANQIFEVIAKK